MQRSSKIGNIDNIRHSLAHLLAASVLKRFPKAKLGIGPTIENGFYYDFLLPRGLTPDDLKEIEKEMMKFALAKLPFSGKKVTAIEAKKLFSVKGGEQPFKLDLIKELVKEKKPLTIYKTGTILTDLCKGGHVKNTSEINVDAFKITKTAGAYWRGDEKNQQLQRIYGLAFETKNELEAHLKMLEEAEKRDHKKLGILLDLFTFSDLVGSGLPLWTPKGTILKHKLDDFVWELRKKRGYEKVEIPHIAKKELYETSGHWDKFQNDLFKITTREGHLFVMKPMNCPHHTQIFKRKPWSYKEMPVRYASTTMVYRDEQSGELSGLSRTRGFAQDDAHVFCRSSQVKEEINKIWEIIHEFYGAFGFDMKVRLSLHNPKEKKNYLGTPKEWKYAEGELRLLLKEKKVEFVEALGEAAFYGPKLDFLAKDSLGREWQVATIQLDMNQPKRFDLTYTNEDGKPEEVLMIHAAIMGSIERFLSIIIEHFGGAFPVWLAPVQVTIIPVSEKFNKYSESIYQKLKDEDVRVELNDANETLGKRIRDGQIQKIPYIVVIGEKEEGSKTINVRHYTRGQEGEIKLEKFLEKIKEEVKNKS